MRRMACVDLPEFPLQLLLERHPDWRDRPAAVVDEPSPQALLRAVNDHARARGIRPGMRYAAASSLDAGLCAGSLAALDLERAVAEIEQRLNGFAPGVEPSAAEPGVFWLDASGLERLHPALDPWAASIRSALTCRGFDCAVVVGFGRFDTYAVARAHRGGSIVFANREQERAAARRVVLERLALPADILEALGKLGIRTVGQFADLPASGIVTRFGPETERVHRAAGGAPESPL
jgi:protein ImuB